MGPRFPKLPGLACEMIPVGVPSVIAPSIVSSPAMRIEALPLAPRPEVLFVISPELAIFRLPAVIVRPPPLPEDKLLLEILPELPMVMLPAVTVTFPPLPGEKVVPEIPVETPVTDSGPDTLTDTSPLFPTAPGAEILETKPSLVRVKAPALTATLPAAPPPRVNEPIPANIEVRGPVDRNRSGNRHGHVSSIPDTCGSRAQGRRGVYG